MLGGQPRYAGGLSACTAGRAGPRCAGLEVGDGVRLAGRLQSRSYTKVEDGVSQQRVAYEVSVMKLEPVELGGT